MRLPALRKCHLEESRVSAREGELDGEQTETVLLQCELLSGDFLGNRREFMHRLRSRRAGRRGY